MYEPELLRTFLAVTQSLSFTRAAASLDLRQPTVSQHVRRLEEAVGRPLFVRDTRSVALTSDGEAMAGYAPRDPRRAATGGEPLQRVAGRGAAPVRGDRRPRPHGAAPDPADVPPAQPARRHRADRPPERAAAAAHRVRPPRRGVRQEQPRHPDPVRSASWSGATGWCGWPRRAPASSRTSRCRSSSTRRPASAAPWRPRPSQDAGRPSRITCTVRGVNGVLAAVRAGLGIAVMAKTLTPTDLVEVPATSRLPKLPNLDLVLLTNPPGAGRARRGADVSDPGRGAPTVAAG